jgi:formate dehydrogenase
MYEREDVGIALGPFFATPFVQATEAVVPPAGEARQEWEIVEQISRRIGVRPYSVPAFRALARIGWRITPRRMLDALIRTGPDGDLFGLRPRGLSLKKLLARPHGVVLADRLPTGVLRSKVRHPSRKVDLAPPPIAAEMRRAVAANGHDPDFPLRLIGMRELRSHNSWMHNAPLLMRGGRSQSLRISPDDASEHGLENGAMARLRSRAGVVEVPIAVTDDLARGTVALPHGWGHRGAGQRLANEHPGVNVNQLSSAEPGDLERLAGMAHLNGIPVRVEPVAATPVKTAATGATA